MKCENMEAFITAFRTARGWTLRRLAEQLGYSSPTSIIRLCQEKANAESLRKFAAAIAALTESPMTDDEAAVLAQLVERGLSGHENYRTNQALVNLMQTIEPPEHPPVVLEDARTGETTTLIKHYLGRKGLRITVLNCELVPIFAELAELEQLHPFPLRHYFAVDGPAYRIVDGIAAILPVLYDPNYQVFSRDVDEKTPMGMMQSDFMVCGWEEDGHLCTDLITFLDRDRGYLMHYDLPMQDLLPLMMIHRRNDHFHPVRMLEIESQTNYIEFTKYCAELEHDRTTMRIKPDLGLDQVPVEILAAAFRDGCPDPSLTEAQLPALVQVFAQRQEHLRVKRKMQYHILMRWGMWRFVRTGRLSDHPWILRPFTVAERKEILLNVLDLMKTNPCFRLYFATDNDVQREDEFMLYDGVGLCIVKPHTDYHLGSTHAEVMISQKRFLEAYRSFYEDSLLRYRVTSHTRTVALLNEMLAYLDNHSGSV